MKSKLHLTIVLTASMTLCAASLAVAGPPFITDDPEPVGLHHWEFYLASIGAWSNHGTTVTAPHCEVNYGALPDVQLHLLAPLVYCDDRDAQRRG